MYRLIDEPKFMLISRS